MLSRVVVTLFYFIWCSRCIHTDTLILSRLLNIQLFLIVWNNPSDRFGGRERDTNSPCSCFCAYTFSILLWFISYAIHNPHQAHWFRRNARHCNHFLSLAFAIFFSASVFFLLSTATEIIYVQYIWCEVWCLLFVSNHLFFRKCAQGYLQLKERRKTWKICECENSFCEMVALKMNWLLYAINWLQSWCFRFFLLIFIDGHLIFAFLTFLLLLVAPNCYRCLCLCFY